ncbi:MAG: sigma-70 family RNA polymerase sigma factor [Proteobacteria bacterium]|nr:sigma-70 family RNA polymerase sigma factor [Pseudomonadota bacterium]
MESDNELFLNTINGDMKSFDKLVDRYMKKAYFFAYGYVGDKEAARDLSQDAFVKVYKERSRFNPDYNFGTWFFTVLRNTCLNYIKRRNIHPFVSMNNTYSYKGNNEDDKIDMAKALHMLNERDKELLTLKYFDGFSYEEISQILGIPMGSVMSGLFYAKKRMKEVIERLYNEP